MIPQIERLNELVAAPNAKLDAVMATVATVDSNAPTERWVADQLDLMATTFVGSPTLANLFDFYFEVARFNGNTTNYYHPSNSLVHSVLLRRTGNPLLLTSVLFELGRRLGVELSIVGLPGHVLIGNGPSPTRWFDPFQQGTELDIVEVEQLFNHLNPDGEFSLAMAAELDTHGVIRRMLMNLRVAYLRIGDVAKLANVLTLRAHMVSSSEVERIELSEILNALGRYELAATIRDHLATDYPDNEEKHVLAAQKYRYRRN